MAIANHSARIYDKTSRKGMSILSAIEKYIPIYQQKDNKEIDQELVKQRREDHDRANYLLSFYQLNKKYVDLPDECYDRAIRAYLTFVKIAGRKDLRLFEFKELSTSTTAFLSELHILLLERNEQGILEFPTGNYDDWYVSFDKLDDFIRREIRAKQSIAERLESELAEKKLIDKKMIEYDLKEENHIGALKLKPFYVRRFKLGGVAIEDQNGQDWSAEDMKKLAADLLAAAEIKEEQSAQK